MRRLDDVAVCDRTVRLVGRYINLPNILRKAFSSDFSIKIQKRFDKAFSSLSCCYCGKVWYVWYVIEMLRRQKRDEKKRETRDTVEG